MDEVALAVRLGRAVELSLQPCRPGGPKRQYRIEDELAAHARIADLVAPFDKSRPEEATGDKAAVLRDMGAGIGGAEVGDRASRFRGSAGADELVAEHRF